MAQRSVFIAYSRSDGGYVQRLVAYLQANNVPVWADNAINHGDHWEDVICHEIDNCAAFVPVMTPEAWQSPWVRNEVARARAKEKPILPLLLAGDFFFGLSHLETEVVTSRQMPGSAYVERLLSLIHGTALPPLPPSGRASAARRRPNRLVPAAVAAAVAVLIMATVAVLISVRGGGQGPSSAQTIDSYLGDRSGVGGTGVFGGLSPGEHLVSPRTIGPLTLQYTTPPPGGNAGTFGYQIHDKTGTLYLLYSDPEHVNQQVVVLAVTGTVDGYETVVDAYLPGVDKDTVIDVDPGRLSGVAKCGVLPNTDQAFISCAWADPGSIGLVYCYYRTQDECAALFPQIRDAVLTRD